MARRIPGSPQRRTHHPASKPPQPALRPGGGRDSRISRTPSHLDAPRGRCAAEMLSAAAGRRWRLPGSPYLAFGCGTGAPAPGPGGPGRGGAGVGRAVGEGRAPGEVMTRLGSGGWGRAPSPLGCAHPVPRAGFPALTSSRARGATAFSSELLLAGPAALKGPVTPHDRRRARMAKTRAAPLERGLTGCVCGLRTEGWQRWVNWGDNMRSHPVGKGP
jgi:hypothetical protein